MTEDKAAPPRAKPPEAPVKPPEAPTKPPEAPAKPPEASTKPPEAPVKPPEPSTKPPEAPTKPPEAPAKPSTAVPVSPAASAPAGVPATLAFDPGQPAAAAVYVRSDQMYLVFDRPLAIGAGVITGSSAGLIGPIQPVLATGGSAFRLTMQPWLRPAIERAGTVWRVLFVPRVQPPRQELPVEAQPEFPLGGRVLVRAPDASSVVELTDPEIGDRLLVVPLPVAVQAVSIPSRFPEVEFLSALQGIVIRPHGDGVAARLIREGVEVTANGGLHLSPVADAATVPADGPGGIDAILSALSGDGTSAAVGERRPSGVAANDYRLLNLSVWQRDGGKEFTKNRQALLMAVADAPPKEKNKARLELARFYFAHGFNQEAIGVLDVLAASQPDLKGWPEFRALRGAALVAAGVPREGLAQLTGPGLDDNREAGLWRAAASTMLGENWARSAHDFSLADDILNSYPEPYFRRLSLLLAETRIQNKDPREADRVLKRLIKRTNPDADHWPSVEFYRGGVLQETGKIDDAIKRFKAAEEGNDRYYRARAGLARVNLEYREKRIAAATAADRLSRLRNAWRGDELELEIIRRHGEMQWQAGEYTEGLNTLREAAAYFPDSSQAAEITQSMSKLFGDLFLDGASKLPPLKAIELYDQFRELTPVGTTGDQVIRQLAERLVQVDLLGRAAELLQHQVDFRLTGLEKASVGTRLTSIRLLDSKPELALQALDASEFQPLPPELAADRRVFRARALTDLRRSNEALKLLEGDTSAPAEMLRVDIAWHDQRWDDAAAALDKLIGAPPAAGKTIEKEVGQRVLNRAIALALAGDTNRLETLRSSFGPAMAKTPEADAFAVLTRREQGGDLIDLASIKARVAEVDIFQNFLKTFQQKTPPPS